ncbi:hypothetical protein PTTG_25702 [Puccinia triticina 1-1 BBBD Race 1]|uniref:Uncharacterized protein n=2 Tax=Puccinia triticina TaxID=208348 RepID=A0A180GZD3_PUCT1|nr:hypothetical protein PTTG_25702 [Puccinia triticina 1-1 BBBD Race 1]
MTSRCLPVIFSRRHLQENPICRRIGYPGGYSVSRCDARGTRCTKCYITLWEDTNCHSEGSEAGAWTS